jgi:hypothetical protein
LSFKSAITSLNAIDCLGWGFSTEAGKQCLRVERWDWFYQPNTIFIVNDAEEVTIDADPDRMISVFIVGYKKYATNDQYNSIDSPHGTREFVSSNKVINQTIDQQSEFIADNYAIEETRRNRYDKSDTEESTYDENIFIIELIKEVTEENPTGVIKIQPTSFNATNVGNENEFINAKITPRHMAARWVDYLFQSNNKTALKFSSGDINFLSSFEVIPEYSVVTNNGTTAEIYSLKSFESSSPQKENDDIAYLQSILKAETIKFSYPITISEYIRIKSNPYGLVHVNGLQGWIKNFKYSFIDGIAEFTLIAKKQ